MCFGFAWLCLVLTAYLSFEDLCDEVMTRIASWCCLAVGRIGRYRSVSCISFALRASCILWHRKAPRSIALVATWLCLCYRLMFSHKNPNSIFMRTSHAKCSQSQQMRAVCEAWPDWCGLCLLHLLPCGSRLRQGRLRLPKLEGIWLSWLSTSKAWRRLLVSEPLPNAGYTSATRLFISLHALQQNYLSAKNCQNRVRTFGQSKSESRSDKDFVTVYRYIQMFFWIFAV